MTEKQRNMDVIITHNDLNKISFPNFTKKELDFLYGTIISLYNKNGRSVRVSFSEIMKAVELEFINKTEADFAPWLNSFTTKAAQVICPMYMIDKNNGELFARVPFFGSIAFSFDYKYIEFKINPDFKYILEKQKSEYTAFSFGLFKSFKKKYDKLLFRLISQWKTVGKVYFEISEFKRLMDVPNSYGPSKIRQSIIDPTVKSLIEVCPGLSAETVREDNRAIGYKFTWDASHFKKLKKDEIAAKNAKKLNKMSKSVRKPKVSEFKVVEDNEYDEMLEHLI